MRQDNNKQIKKILNFNIMFLYLIFIEVINLLYTVVISEAFYLNLGFTLVLLIFLLLYKVLQKKEDIDNKFSYALIILYYVHFVFYTIYHESLFLFGFYFLEIAIVLVFANFNLIKKIIINYSYLILIFVVHFSFNSMKHDILKEMLFLIIFSSFVLVGIIISQRLFTKFKIILRENENNSNQIIASNSFYKSILDQERIKVFYYFPDMDKAILVSNNFSDRKDKEIENFFKYVRENNIVSLEYFGIIQNAIKEVREKGCHSVILPVSNDGIHNKWMKFSCTRIFDETINQDKILVSTTDVDDLKTVELKFKNALTQCSISTWEYDIQNDEISSYNDSILDYYFYGNPIKNIVKSFIARAVIYSKDIDVFKNALKKVKKGESEVSFEIRIFPSINTAYTWVRLNFSCFKDNLNKPTHAWVSVENIDDAKASEKWFEIEREKNFDNKLGLIAMAEINVSRNFVINSNILMKYKGIGEKKDSTIKTLVDSVLNIGKVDGGVDFIYERYEQKYLLDNYEKGRRILDFEYKVVTKENDVLYLSNIIKLFLDLKTKEIIAFTFLYDITAEHISKISFDAILNTKFVYLSYVNLINSHMSILRTQLVDVTDKSNPNRIYNLEWTAYINRYVHESDKDYVHSQIDIENVKKELQDKNTFSFDYKISDNGNMLSYRRCHFVRSELDSPFILIMEENVTNEMITRIKNELVLKEALIQAQQAANAKNYFLTRMSHEIRTPLSAIIGLSELGTASKTNDIKEYFSKINDSGHYLLGLVNDILDMNKIELGQIDFKEDFIDIEDFYKMIIALVENQAANKKIHFQFIQKGTYYRYQILEKLRLHQILLNILNNAIKYTYENGKVIYTVENIEKDDKLYALHTVEDTGVCISAEFLKTIYEPFTRERNSLSDTEGGTGLGLAICANLVKQLNGEINIESELSVGTKVTILLPLKVVTKEEFDKNAPKKMIINHDKMYKDKKILVAEDHETNAMIVQKILKNMGIKTVHVINGKKAVEVFNESKENEFDLILMDIMMPELNGLEAAREIRALDRKDSKTVPIIALSANAFAEDKNRSLEYGMNDHLKKPIETKVLLETLKKYI